MDFLALAWTIKQLAFIQKPKFAGQSSPKLSAKKDLLQPHR